MVVACGVAESSKGDSLYSCPAGVTFLWGKMNKRILAK